MSVVCKFKLQSIEMYEGSRRKRDENGSWIKRAGGFVTEPCLSGQIKLVPVYANDDQNHENSKFWDASPSGEFTMSVNNLDALKHLEVAKQYYITIAEAK